MAEADALTGQLSALHSGLGQLSTSAGLPEAWHTVPLDAIAHIRLGRTPARDNRDYWQSGAVPWVSIGDLNDGLVRQTKERISELAHREVFKREVVEPGTILLSFKLTIGKLGILAIPAVHNEAIASLRLSSPDMDKDFLFYALQTLDYDSYLDTYVKGRTLNKDKLRSLQVLQPPLPQQRAIARALRAVQSAIQARRCEVELERERKSALMQRLFTYGTRGEPTKQTEIGKMPESWEVTTLDDDELFNLQNGTWTGKKPPLVDCAVLRNTNFREDGMLDTSNVATISIEQRELERKRLLPGDIIIERSGGGPQQPVGRVALYNLSGDYTFSNFTSRVRILSPHVVDAAYLHAYLLYFHQSGGTEQLQRRTTGIRNLDFTAYKSAVIPLPSPEEQSDIARAVAACTTKCDALELEVQSLQELFRAMLERLMTGRLSALPLVDAIDDAEVSA